MVHISAVVSGMLSTTAITTKELEEAIERDETFGALREALCTGV